MNVNLASAPLSECPARLVVPTSSSRYERLQAEPSSRIFLKRRGSDAQQQATVSNFRSLKTRWSELAQAYNSSSIGIVVRPGPPARAVLSMIRDGLGGDQLPGAIVVNGADLGFLNELRGIAEETGQEPVVQTSSGASLPFEWPPIMMLIEADGLASMRCARVASDLRASGVPVAVVSPPSDSPRSRGRDDIGEFLRSNLVDDFPRMF